MKANRNDTDLRRTVRISIAEGIFAQIYSSLASLGSVFITKFAVMLGASPFHFGVLAAIGQLSQIFQPLGVAITRDSTSRKSAVIRLVLWGRSLSFLIGFLPFVLPRSMQMWAFLFIIFLSTSLSAIGGNAWIAWIADMVPLRIRGRFFSIRSRYLMIAGLLTGFIFGGFIDLFNSGPGKFTQKIHSFLGSPMFLSSDNLRYAFLAIFAIATLAGIIGLRILNKQPEKTKGLEKESFISILREPLANADFRKFLGYGFWWMLAVGIAAPFWGPFMIQKLHMSIIDIQIYGTISTFASLASLKFWGIFIDRFGNKTSMRFAIVLGGLNPLVWVFATPELYWITYIEAFFSGIMWAGAGIIATNFVLAIAPENKRQIYSGIFGAFSGIAMMITTLLSGILIPAPMEILGLHIEPEQVLFALTGFARWSTQIPLSWIKEPRGKPVGEALYYFQQFAKVRIAQIAGWVFRRDNPPDIPE